MSTSNNTKTCVVIGSNCFTGSHLVDALLADGDRRVIGISRTAEASELFLPYKQRDLSLFSFHQIDLVRETDRLLALIDDVRPQIVINVAALSEVALSHERPIEYFETNTIGVVRLCNHLRHQTFLDRYIHISSAEIYGPCDRSVPENAPKRPSTPYAVSKAAADMFLETLIANFRFPATLIRSTNVYGAHQQLFKIIPRTVIYLRLGKTIELHGGGRAKKHFVHIRDVVRGTRLAMNNGRSGTYHFSVNRDLTIRDIVSSICGKMGHDPARAIRVVDERLGQDTRYWLDCSRSESELGWSPQIDFDDGAQEVIDWVEANWDQILREPLEYQHKA